MVRSRASRGQPALEPVGAGYAADDGTRRTEILHTAAALIASTGLRTSLQEIADACGILPGSLYHHFESKEAILVELLQRYHTDLDEVARHARETLQDNDARPPLDRVTDLAVAIARCAVAHRAALQMSFYEGPAANPALVELTRRRPTVLLEVMTQTLRAARVHGDLAAGIEAPLLADRITQTMLYVGLDVIRHHAPADQVALVFCRILLHGLATGPLDDAALDGSPAFLAADRVVRSWAGDGEDGADAKTAHIRAVARAEFGRRGYEGTTVRDIATAAGLGTGSVYRLIGSKEELLASIMRSFGEKVAIGWTDVLRCDASPVAKLDALSWINTNMLARFGDEFRIQLAWMRQSPPDTPNPGWHFAKRIRQMKSLLAQGIRSGEIAIEHPSQEMLTRCVIGASWVPENILADIGPRAAQLLVRDTTLRGVVTAR
ncbi:TetR/AcrR family transcriptional regulator [Nocardia sp. alder85J]|uniref:TetR/AcrR family transcriptional regulator n=1 Tax=Nocardia sp. alder85J TaxID=2862949 RepID=UPI001CD43B60|nr:TetR/AcrR family transcriptional regulator [Nocardia sp. alder85J]MCX4098524.1 TetR/AcrR family transcriptional regulator [Nocardia sp. alder85J]